MVSGFLLQKLLVFSLPEDMPFKKLIFREKGKRERGKVGEREAERERDIDQLPPACAPTGN